MFQNFTRRHGLDKPDYDLKYEYVPPAFRFDLYKAVTGCCENKVHEYCLYRDVAITINRDNFRLGSVDEIEEYYNPDFFVEMLQDASWHEVLSIIEFLVNSKIISGAEADELFQYHNVGYRIEEDYFAKNNTRVVVHYESLIEDKERILELDIPYEGVINLVKAAYSDISSPGSLNLEQSIKHSIDAVEGYLKGWLDDKGIKVATLGDAIKSIQNKDIAPPNIVKALEQFYVYRNRTPNVGHGSPELANVEKEEARLCFEMAVSYINYFYRKT